MPKKLCRTRLDIVSIRPERLHSITDQDAINEGIEKHIPVPGDGCTIYKCYADRSKYAQFYMNPVNSYMSLWIKLNGLDSWLLNPWVWRIEYKIL
jgi:hypothetical protein